MTADHTDVPRCSATAKGSGERCKRRPVPGGYVCVKHGGGAPQVRQAAAARLEQSRRAMEVAAAQERFGIPVEVDAGQALVEQLHRTYGAVVYLSALVSSLPKEQLKQRDLSGKFERSSVWVEMLAAAEDRHREVAKTLLALGLAEREVRLQEQQGQLLAAGLGWFLERLHLDQDPTARELLGQMLRALAEGRSPAIEGSVVA